MQLTGSKSSKEKQNSGLQGMMKYHDYSPQNGCQMTCHIDITLYDVQWSNMIS